MPSSGRNPRASCLGMAANRSPGSVCRYPFPYSALLAISSDLDDTPDWAEYLELTTFLASGEATSLGTGLGLEFANSLYFAAPLGQFSYWGASDVERDRLRILVQSGHVDTMHSFGDLATTRAHAQRSIDELEAHDCQLPIWVDHAQAVTNLGHYQTRGFGDVPGHAAYHADLIANHGVTYCWRGQVTGIVGQDTPISLRSLCRMSRRHPATPRTAAKEMVKAGLSCLGSGRYRLHGPNRVLQRVELRDGSKMFEFLRCNPHWAGLPAGDSADAVAEALSKDVLQELVDRGGSMIFYTHLGRRLPRPNTEAFRRFRSTLERIRELQANRRLLVLSTARALDYLAVRHHAIVTHREHEGAVDIDIDPDQEDGLTRSALARSQGAGISVLVGSRGPVRMRVCGRAVKDVAVDAFPECAMRVASVPFRPLDFPQL